MRNAMQPGNNRKSGVQTPHSPLRVLMPSHNGPKPSTGIAREKRTTNMTGDRKKMLEKGLEVAGLRRSRICVRAHRSPEKNAAEMTRKKPPNLNSTSPNTIRMTPNVIVAMMATRRQVGVSRRNTKAKSRTKARDEDLHMV
uniref:Uncharacterized protein n=1 Tax=Photinus pyralis TaxID=7054 RepID=A0A1Y1KR47_PHOPY